jgi:hypothetical protein
VINGLWCFLIKKVNNLSRLTNGRWLLARVYYEIKPLIPRSLQICWRKLLIPLVEKKYQHIWPIDNRAGTKPKGWRGWPDNKKFAFVLTHDVDTVKGEDRCLELMRLDKNAGFKSAFYFVPGRVTRSQEIFAQLKKNGFEVGVHGLFHDGKLFISRKQFQKRVPIINNFLLKWGAVGFRGDCMHHELGWIHDLNIRYDCSTFDVDPFEPQPDGMTSIFPIGVESPITGNRYIELPYTLPQDFMLFVIMRQKNIDIWKKKLDWVAANGGMAMVIAHPDYMNFESTRPAMDEYSAAFYQEFLAYVKTKYDNQFWHALPSEVAKYVVANDSVPTLSI